MQVAQHENVVRHLNKENFPRDAIKAIETPAHPTKVGIYLLNSVSGKVRNGG